SNPASCGSPLTGEIHDFASSYQFLRCIPHSHDQASGIVERLEMSDNLTVGKPDTDAGPKTSSMRQPIDTNGGKILSPVPLFNSFQHLARKRREKRGSRGSYSACGQIGGGISRFGRVAHAIDPDPDHNCTRAVALDEDSGDLGTAEQNIIGPLDREVRLARSRRLNDGIVHR